MKKKLLSSTIITVALTIGAVVPSFAADTAFQYTAVSNSILVPKEEEAKISKEEAKALAISTLKKYFDLTIDESKFQTQISLSQSMNSTENNSWEMYFSKSDHSKSMHIHVAIDAQNKKVTRIHRNEFFHNEQTPPVATITNEKAREIAEAFIQKIHPKEYKEVKYQEDSFSSLGYGSGFTNHEFTYIRQVNDLPFAQNQITIGVNAVDGSISRYNYSWDDTLSFPNKETAITKEKAKEILDEKLDPMPRYISEREQGDYSQLPKAVKLVYSPFSSDEILLDGIRGEMTNWEVKSQEAARVKDVSEEQKKGTTSAESLAKSTKELNSAEATVLLKAKLKELLKGDYEIENIRYSKGNDVWESRGKKAWSAEFIQKSSLYSSGQITIDATTGEIISLYTYDRDMENIDSFVPKLSWEQAYDEAINVIRKYYPDKLNQIKTKQQYSKNIYGINNKILVDRIFSFNFPRIINGIEYNEHSINISFDAKTGSLTNLSLNWNETLQFPDPKNGISKEEGKKLFSEAYGPELIYILRSSTAVNETNPPKDVRLIYTLVPEKAPKTAVYLDALTREFVDYNANKAGEPQNRFHEKIKGHKAEKELSILGFQGIVDAASFDPAKEITHLEWIKMLVRAKGYNTYNLNTAEDLKFQNISKDDPNYSYLQLAVKYGIIENSEGKFVPEATVPREEMIRTLVKLLDYDRLAKSTDIFTLSFEDAKEIRADQIGYVAIAKGLNILEKEDKKFRPKEKATMAEAALCLYKALDNIKK